MILPDTNDLNRNFYDSSGDLFNKIPFGPLLPALLLKYPLGSKVLEIGSGPGALGLWLRDRGCDVTCLEPAKKLAERAAKKGLTVHSLTIQEFEAELKYDSVIAISSLIHVPKKELPAQIKKIAHLLKAGGIFIASFIQGEGEGCEDPTKSGRLRYFVKLSESELAALLFPYFTLLESQVIRQKKMSQIFFLNTYSLNEKGEN